MAPTPPFPPSSSLRSLLDGVVRPGVVTWIGVRPARHAPICELDEVALREVDGVDGDHYEGRSLRRQVSLIGTDDLAAIGAFLHRGGPAPATLLRRNIVVAGINLLALKDRSFRLGGAVLRMTEPCHPCSRMETTLGPGGYNAVRGHGGILATVVAPGLVRRGDTVERLELEGQAGA